MTPLPIEPAGDHPLVEVIRRLIRCLRERTPISGPNADVQRFAEGFRIEPKPPRGGGAPGKDKPVWL